MNESSRNLMCLISLREDIDPSQRCYVAKNNEGAIVGYLQEFANGSAAYWREPLEQAEPATSLEEAVRRLLRF
jgi:hypothetical protein